MPKLPQRPGGYARISQDKRGTALGVQRQIDNGNAFCAARGWGPLRWFVDNDISASTKSTKERPEYNNIRRAAESGEIDGFFVYNMDRLTRRMTELVEFLPWLTKTARIPFMTTEGDDTETANGRMVIQIKGAVAQQEAERIAERLELAYLQRKQRRIYTAFGSMRPWGWTDGSFGDHEDDEANAFIDGSAIIVANGTPGDVLRHWQQKKVKTVTGTDWFQLRSVKRMFDSPRFAGLMLDENGELVMSENIKPIIDAETFRKIQAALEVRTITRGKGYGARVHLFSGFIRCGACGHRMAAQVAPSRSRWHCEKTRGGCGKVSRNFFNLNTVLEAMIVLALKAHPADEEIEIDGDNPEHALEIRIAQIAEKIESTRQAWGQGLIDDEDYYPQLSMLRDMMKETKREQATVVVRDNTPKGDEALAIWLDPNSTLEQRRAIVESLIVQVTVKPTGKTGRAPMAEDSFMVVWR